MIVFIYGIIYSSKINILFFFSISAYGVWRAKTGVQVSRREFHTHTHMVLKTEPGIEPFF